MIVLIIIAIMIGLVYFKTTKTSVGNTTTTTNLLIRTRNMIDPGPAYHDETE